MQAPETSRCYEDVSLVFESVRPVAGSKDLDSMPALSVEGRICIPRYLVLKVHAVFSVCTPEDAGIQTMINGIGDEMGADCCDLTSIWVYSMLIGTQQVGGDDKRARGCCSMPEGVTRIYSSCWIKRSEVR